MASSSSMWLPPLNSHYPTETNVYISQEVSGTENGPLDGPIFTLDGPIFILKFHAMADFESNEPPLENFPGLGVHAAIEIPMNEVSRGRMASELRDHSSLRFAGNIRFSESHFEDLDELGHRIYTSFELSGSAEFYEKILNFLCVTTEKTQNSGADSIEIQLIIMQQITVPRDELESWHAWYEEKKRNDPRFVDRFSRAIERPRTEEEQGAMVAVPDIREEELLETEEVEFGDLGANKCCCICFEDFLPHSEPRKLGCDHVYDRECIEKWLRHANKCPLCRFN